MASQAVTTSAEPRTPDALRLAVAQCRACELWQDATHSVSGEGPVPARVMLVGEQPGDLRRGDPQRNYYLRPDHPQLADQPGPAGGHVHAVRALVDPPLAALAEAKMLHRVGHEELVAAQAGPLAGVVEQPPRGSYERTCGAVLLALLGPGIRIGRDRGVPQPSELAELVLVTAHPSAALRMRDGGARAAALDALVADLEQVTRWLNARS